MNPRYTADVAENAIERSRHRIERWLSSDRIELLIWGAVLAGLTADLVSTTVGLEAGLTEGNPLMRWGLSVWGPAALVGLKMPIVAVAVGLRLYRVDFGYAAALGLAVLWNVVAAINVVAMV
ncbi:MAG: DUF5658 family protein [Halococcoides sp.]